MTESPETTLCPACDGDGRIRDKTGGGHHGVCPVCKGTGILTSQVCPMCLGRKVLPTCNPGYETRYFNCPRRHSTGTVPVTADDDPPKGAS